jgi:hypothetical protein
VKRCKSVMSNYICEHACPWPNASGTYVSKRLTALGVNCRHPRPPLPKQGAYPAIGLVYLTAGTARHSGGEQCWGTIGYYGWATERAPMDGLPQRQRDAGQQQRAVCNLISGLCWPHPSVDTPRRACIFCGSCSDVQSWGQLTSSRLCTFHR